jgi:hypothetical protein
MCTLLPRVHPNTFDLDPEVSYNDVLVLPANPLHNLTKPLSLGLDHTAKQQLLTVGDDSRR